MRVKEVKEAIGDDTTGYLINVSVMLNVIVICHLKYVFFMIMKVQSIDFSVCYVFSVCCR